MKTLLFTLLVFLLGGLPFPGQAQISQPLSQAFEKTIPSRNFSLSIPTSNTNSPQTPPPKVSSILTTPVPKAYHYEHLGAFCKLEVQLEKAVRLPVKVRLGEVQYTEQLEYGEW